jgi:hypothetical protein
MCNGYRHSRNTCDCGFGPGRRGCSTVAITSPPQRRTWPYRHEDFCRESKCPMCDAPVFFVRHNGGSVWFDKLSPPWPKHGCFSDNPEGVRLRQTLIRWRSLPTAFTTLFGIVIDTEATHPGSHGRIVVRCSDNTMIDGHFNTRFNLMNLPDTLIIVIRRSDGHIVLRSADSGSQTNGLPPTQQGASDQEFFAYCFATTEQVGGN